MNAISRGIFLFSIFILLAVHADDKLKVNNATPRNLYVGIYHQELPTPKNNYKPQLAQLATTTTFIESGTEKIIDQAARRTRFDRIMTCAENKELLKPELPNEELLGEKYNGKNVGDMQGDTFYIGDNDAKFYIYSPTEWKVNQPINVKECSKNTKNLPAVVNNPYQDKVAQVRIGNDLSEDEHAFVTKRLPRVKQTLENILQMNVAHPLKIAVVCNGTGMRSALYCLGALQGLQEMGILDASLYIASTAGATWGISSWYSSGMELSSFNQWIIQQLQNGITSVSSQEATAIGQSLMTKFVSNQPIGAVDMYGALLSNVLCGWSKDHQHIYVSGQAERIKDGQLPMPLYTAVRAEHTSIKHQAYEWNPFEAGSLSLKMYTPIWGFGRKFDKGSSINTAPELTLGNLMGIWGFQRSGIITQQLENAALNKKMKTECTKNLVSILYESLDSYRSFEAQVPNFTRGMPKSPIPYSILLTLTDAHASLSSSAYPVVSGERPRDLDVLIFIDASQKLQALDMAQSYAQARNISFIPNNSFGKVKESVVSIFKGGSQLSTVIYQPLIVDEKSLRMVSLSKPEFKTRIQSLEKLDIYKCMGQGACASDNFVYTPVQAQQIVDLGYINMLSSKEKIIAALGNSLRKN